MAQTPILAIPQIAEGQSSAYLVANAGITALEEAENRQLAVDMSGGDVTLTETQFLRNVLFRCSGQVDDDNLTIPDEITVDGSPVTPQRKFLVRNDSDTYSVTVTDGTLTFEIPTESTALLIYDGTNLDGIVAADDASALTALTDTPANYTGSGGFFIRVKDDESGVEFVTIKAQELGVDVTDSANYTTLNFDDTVFGASASGGVLTIDFDPAQISVTDLADMPAAPGASEDGMALIWDNDADAFVFGEAGGGGGSGVYSLTENAQTGTTYTPVLTDADNKYVSLDNAGAVTVTIPANATTAFDVGDVINLVQIGAGQVTVAAAGGVTINYPANRDGKTRGQNSWVQLVKQATDEWYASGDLAYTGSALADAADVAYDNTDSGLTASDVQAAIDELAESGGGGGGGYFGPMSGATTAVFSTAVANGTAAGSASDDSDRGLVMSVNTGSNDSWYMRLKSTTTPGSGTDTHIARFIVDFEAENTSSKYPAAGFILRNSTNGRAVFFGVERPSAQAQSFGASTWTNASYGSAVGTADVLYMDDFWLKVEIDDTGDVRLYRSRAGTLWTLVASTTIAAFLEASTGAFDQIGFGTKYHSGATGAVIPVYEFENA